MDRRAGDPADRAADERAVRRGGRIPQASSTVRSDGALHAHVSAGRAAGADRRERLSQTVSHRGGAEPHEVAGRDEQGAHVVAARSLFRLRQPNRRGDWRILGAIEPIARTTVVVFVADHGELLGDHGLWGKRSFLGGSLQIPLIIRRPDETNPGSVVEDLVSQRDVGPTILGLAGLPVPQNLAGTDLFVVVRPEAKRWLRPTALATSAWLHTSPRRTAGPTPSPVVVSGCSTFAPIPRRPRISLRTTRTIRPPPQRVLRWRTNWADAATFSAISTTEVDFASPPWKRSAAAFRETISVVVAGRTETQTGEHSAVDLVRCGGSEREGVVDELFAELPEPRGMTVIEKIGEKSVHAGIPAEHTQSTISEVCAVVVGEF